MVKNRPILSKFSVRLWEVIAVAKHLCRICYCRCVCHPKMWLIVVSFYHSVINVGSHVPSVSQSDYWHVLSISLHWQTGTGVLSAPSTPRQRLLSLLSVCFLAESHKKWLNQASFVLLCFVLFAFSGLCLVFVVSVFNLSSILYFPVWTNMNGTV